MQSREIKKDSASLWAKFSPCKSLPVESLLVGQLFNRLKPSENF
jgi:hypothetical protein